MDKVMSNMEKLTTDETSLAHRIAKKKEQLQYDENRLKNLESVRPQFMDEYERLEKDLRNQYAVYLERFRNLEYLEHELDLINKQEEDKMQEQNRTLAKMQKKLREENIQILKQGGTQFDEEIDPRDKHNSHFGETSGGFDEPEHHPRAQSRAAVNRPSQRMVAQGSLNAQFDDDESDSSAPSTSSEDEDDEDDEIFEDEDSDELTDDSDSDDGMLSDSSEGF
eukprot:TRINITY_DN1637_c0_g1_i6.p1 TRINITY_DN1637_c0_g1~~TRINITY_DN1637_c0_g1_i6.p1  ORF type:complete len:223 (+),score=97.71 TRINITY_DN1637_c0_g1_i6:421-1089(+)